MLNIKLNSKGVSLPLVVGLVLLLMLASVATNELVIKALRSAHQIEASDRAYFAAEAGIEDALYELSEHFYGYETGSIRNDDFGGDIRWNNDWEILNRSNSFIFGTDTDENLVLLPNQKLIIGLSNDNSFATVLNNGINPNSPQTIDVNLLPINSLSVTFRIPHDLATGYSPLLTDGLQINNDKDDDVNEDGPGTPVEPCGGDYAGKDDDCDGKEDEDSEQDPVILWKITDNMGNSLIPIRGCFDGTPPTAPATVHPYDPIGTEICEKDFFLDGEYYLAMINQSTEGIDQNNDVISIGEFISQAYEGTNNRKVQLEFLIVAPLIDSDNLSGADISIPYLEYTISSDSELVPLPYFTINSDGFYKDYKQSITTTVTPKTAVPLFDFTIIQQQ